MVLQYDYIITGAGCAGLSLLMRLLQEPPLNTKKILVVDQSAKTGNDRTWCFWEKEEGLFEPIIHHRWQELAFKSNEYDARFSIAPYHYKMIRGIDFYQYVINYAKQFPNIEFRYEQVKKISTVNHKGRVELENETIEAAYIFNSILFQKPLTISGTYYLLQHFKGWLIETKEPCFDPLAATFMDFTVSQKRGTAFMYVLPISSVQALVEYTLFTEKVLEQREYKTALQEYIGSKLNVREYSVTHEEVGVIPMTNYRFPRHEGKTIHIGIAGGQAKGSSGYAFQFIQKRTEKIIRSLLQHNHPFTPLSFSDKKFHLYDSVLLSVLHNRKLNGDEIFAGIFSRNSPERIFRFLDNESNIIEDIAIMGSVPGSVFLPAAVRELLK